MTTEMKRLKAFIRKQQRAYDKRELTDDDDLCDLERTEGFIDGLETAFKVLQGVK